MTFGQIIKKLRRDADMTQERLAEVLSVSAQAVSRWETDTGMPDVSLLPPLANLFGVTTDYLLGVDITKKDENIDAIREKANAYSDRGYFAEAREILEQGLKQYPNNYRMMRDLMYVSFYQYRAASDAKDTELAEKYKSEAIDLGEAILAGSTEDRTRHSAVQILCFLYKDSENAKRAVELAESMHSMAISRDFLLPDLADGDRRYEKTQRKVFDLVQFLEVAIGSMNVKLDSGEYAYTSEMRAALRDKQIAFLHLMFEKPLHVLCHRVIAHVHRFTDSGVARMALKGFSVLAVHQIGVHENFTRSQPQAKDAFRHRKIFAGDVAGVVVIKCFILFAQSLFTPFQ